MLGWCKITDHIFKRDEVHLNKSLTRFFQIQFQRSILPPFEEFNFASFEGIVYFNAGTFSKQHGLSIPHGTGVHHSELKQSSHMPTRVGRARVPF